MFKGLKDAANKAASAVTESVGTAQDIKDKAEDIANGLQSRAPTMRDVRNLLNLLEHVPGIDKTDINNGVLAESVGILQAGAISIVFTYDGKDFQAEAMKLDKISIDQANDAAGSQKYSKAVISESDNPEDANIVLIMNDAKIAETGDEYLTKRLLSFLIVKAVMYPIEQIPLLGTPIAFILEPPCELIVDFLVNQAFDEFKRAGLAKESTAPAQPVATPPKNGPLPGA